MLSELYRYLILHKHVSIPGVGNFSVKKNSPAFSNAGFSAPSDEILFTEGTALTDKSFYHFLSAEKGITEVEAVRKFQDFAYQLRKDIQSDAPVELTGVGTLKKNALGVIVFESSVNTQQYFPAINPPLLDEDDGAITPETSGEVYYEEEQPKKDRWWIATLVISLLSIAAIVYYYLVVNNQ